MAELEMDKVRALEALLFYYGEPLSLKKIAKFLSLKENEAQDLAADLKTRLETDRSRGLALLFRGNDVQLGTKPEFQEIGKKLIADEFREELSPASLETLSIIAYLGPIPRSKIDYLRGVNSSFTLRSLLMRGLIDRNLEAEHGNQYYYQTSFDFLKHLGLNEAKNLPEYEKYRNLLQNFEGQEKPKTA